MSKYSLLIFLAVSAFAQQYEVGATLGYGIYRAWHNLFGE